MEILNPNIPRGIIRIAIFDFDGTLSLLREGWPAIMHALMFEALTQTPMHENENELRAFITQLIYSTAGQQTIYQMIRLTDEVTRRGGAPQTAQAYLDQFTAHLLTRVQERIAAIQAGTQTANDWLVPDSIAILRALRARGIPCYILSGTGEDFVRAEAALLGLAPYFANIFGAHADYKNHSKQVVIGKLVAQHQLQPGELLMFGDGPFEISDTKAVGGIAIGVASNEDTRDGRLNPHKRQVLIHAGADMLIPDYREHVELLTNLFPQ